MPIPSSSTAPVVHQPLHPRRRVSPSSNKACQACTHAPCPQHVKIPPSKSILSEKQCDNGPTVAKTPGGASLLANHALWTDLCSQRLPTGSLGDLYPGSRFMGVQKSQANHYDVAVDIQHVDLKNYTLCGYLRISGLTALYPEIITFFEGEIIGPKHSFLTRKWQANSSVDENHWQRFPSFTPYLDTFNKDGFSYNPLEEDCVFMRWKERFLVPDHHVSNIDGASYAGFYYICYSRSTKTIHGLYYYRSNVEWYQELTLYQASNSMGQFASLEFR